MNKETWTLPDGSEIRVDKDETSSTYRIEQGEVLLTTWDPHLVELAKECQIPGESLDAAFERVLIESLEAGYREWKAAGKRFPEAPEDGEGWKGQADPEDGEGWKFNGEQGEG